jgi:UDP-MurNAc hydroxylase
MQLTFYDNAMATLAHGGFQLLMDPWLTEGAFEGSWFHYPPMKTRPEDLLGVDALFVSHLHPDHFDERVLARFRKDIPLVVLDHGHNFLHRKLHDLGFTNLVPIRAGETGQVGPFDLTLYAPFERNIFHEATIGNVLDCALVAVAGGKTVLNANDNRPSLRAAQALRERHGKPTVAMLNYVAASPYPASCDNLSDAEKRQEAARVLGRNLDHLVELVKILEPDVFMPFAGNYVLAGKAWRKNVYIAGATWDAAAAYIAAKVPGQATLCLLEGQTYDLDTGERPPYQPIDPVAQAAYIEHELAGVTYPHEADPPPTDLAELLPRARTRLQATQDRFGLHMDYNVYVDTPLGPYHFNLARPGGELGPSKLEEPYLRFRLDPRLLRRILLRQAHWDSGESGGHIDFLRVPNEYQPDVHTLMSFFHV